MLLAAQNNYERRKTMQNVFKIYLMLFVCLLVLPVSLMAENPFEIILALNHCTLSARLNHYDVDRNNLLLERRSVPLLNTKTHTTFQNSEWTIILDFKENSKSEHIIDATVEFICEKGALEDASLSLDLEFSSWITRLCLR